MEAVCELKDPRPREAAAAVIGADTTWTSDRVWVLEGLVTVVPSVTLTIEPGTVIVGQKGSALVSRSGGRIVARGTREAPIIFTSAKPLGARLAGDWGGVAMLGQAPVNRENFSLRIIPDSEEALFGGNRTDWDCGVMEYVRIEFGGGQVNGEEALNGLTLGGCGSQTVIDHVHVHFGADDGVEIFGGTLDLRYVLVSRAQDDGFDIDTGWRGTGQFLAVLQDSGGDNAVEIDNLGEDPEATPQTDFTIYNYTLIGDPEGGDQRGITFKAGGQGTFSHGIIMGHPLEAIDVFGTASGMRGLGGDIDVTTTLFFQIGLGGTHYFPLDGEPGERDPDDSTKDDDGGFREHTHFQRTEARNRFGIDPGIADPYDLLTPNFVPAAEQVSGGIAPPPAPFDPTAVYLGAFAPNADPWTEDWTAFPSN